MHEYSINVQPISAWCYISYKDKFDLQRNSNDLFPHEMAEMGWRYCLSYSKLQTDYKNFFSTVIHHSFINLFIHIGPYFQSVSKITPIRPIKIGEKDMP